MVDSDTANALAALAVFLGGFVSAIAARVAHRGLRNQATERLDQPGAADARAELARESVEPSAFERVTREVFIREDYRGRVAALDTEPDSLGRPLSGAEPLYRKSR